MKTDFLDTSLIKHLIYTILTTSNLKLCLDSWTGPIEATEKISNWVSSMLCTISDTLVGTPPNVSLTLTNTMLFQGIHIGLATSSKGTQLERATLVLHLGGSEMHERQTICIESKPCETGSSVSGSVGWSLPLGQYMFNPYLL